MCLLIDAIKDKLALYPKLKYPYHYDFVVNSKDNKYEFLDYSSFKKYPELNEAINQFILEKYKESINDGSTFFVEITKYKISVDRSYIDEFEFNEEE